jgi:hypothetical protein
LSSTISATFHWSIYTGICFIQWANMMPPSSHLSLQAWTDLPLPIDHSSNLLRLFHDCTNPFQIKESDVLAIKFPLVPLYLLYFSFKNLHHKLLFPYLEFHPIFIRHVGS